MTNRKSVIVAMSKKRGAILIKCLHTQKELTDIIKYPKFNPILCYHGVITAKEFDELI